MEVGGRTEKGCVAPGGIIKHHRVVLCCVCVVCVVLLFFVCALFFQFSNVENMNECLMCLWFCFCFWCCVRLFLVSFVFSVLHRKHKRIVDVFAVCLGLFRILCS